MSQKGLSQRQMDDEFVRGVLMPVYYRHEFARRNEDVVKESQDVLKHFPLSCALFGGGSDFLDAGGSVTLADALATEYTQESSKSKVKKAMRETLGTFVKEREVLPVPSPPLPFFPKEMGYREPTAGETAGKGKAKQRDVKAAERLFAIWRSLIGFERFLLAEGMTDKPCFLSVVPLNLFHGTEGIYDVKSDRMGQISKQRLMVAIDSTQSLENLGTNLELLIAQLDVLDKLRQKGNAAARKTQRMPWSSFDLYLQVVDFQNDTTKYDTYNAEVYAFFEKLNRKPVSKEDLVMAVNNFNNWEREAAMWKDEFRNIT